ncbi:MAG: EamA family transporter [Candidatus Magasanikbacteria bacterium]
MLWVFLQTGAHFLWAWTNVGDKYVVEKRIQDPYVFTFLRWIFGILVIIIIPFIDFYVIETKFLLLLAFTGFIYFYGAIPYVKALGMEEISRVNVLWNFVPIFTFVIAWIFIDQKLYGFQLLAFFLLLFGSILASIHITKGFFKLSKALFWMMFASVIYATYATIFSYVTQFVPFLLAFVWMTIFMLLSSVFLFFSKNFRSNLNQTFHHIDSKLGLFLCALSITDYVAVGINIWALSLGPAALVFAFEGMQTIFVFSIAVLFSIFIPHILKEELDKKNVFLKIVALVLMLCAIIILAFH